MPRSCVEKGHLATLLDDEEIEDAFDSISDIKAILRFEAALALAQSMSSVIPHSAANEIAETCARLEPMPQILKERTAVDGVVVPALVEIIRAAVSPAARDYVHFKVTSQDAIDTSLMIRLKVIAQIYRDRLNGLLQNLDSLSREHGGKAVMARTRIRDAYPITLADRIAGWREPLRRSQQQLEQLLDGGFLLQLGGPVGISGCGCPDDVHVAQNLAQALALSQPQRQWQTARWPLVDIANWMSMTTGALGKLAKDVLLMAQDGIGEVVVQGAGRSSSMLHKKNPIKAEVIVAQAAFNATLIGGIHSALMAENERSGSAWTLEWLIIPQMAKATGCSLRSAGELLASINFSHLPARAAASSDAPLKEC